MRLVVALLLAAVAITPTAAQKATPSQPNPSGQADPSNPRSQSDEILRQRLLLRERFNKNWDIQPESPRERKARCRGEARKRYSALHPLKRRRYERNCMAGTRH